MNTLEMALCLKINIDPKILMINPNNNLVINNNLATNNTIVGMANSNPSKNHFMLSIFTIIL